MLDGLLPLAHSVEALVEPALNGVENMLMLPTRNPPLLAGGAAALEGAALAGIGPVAAQEQPVFLAREAVGETFTGRTDIEIPVGHVAACLLKRSTALAFEVIGFGSVTVMSAAAHARISSLLK